MRTTQRYIHGQIYKAVLFVAAGFLLLFAFFDVLNELSFTSRTPVPYGLANSLAYIGLLVPGHAYELLPMAVLAPASVSSSSGASCLRRAIT